MRAATTITLLGAALAAATLAAGQSPPAEQTAYFLGEVKTVAPSGQPLSTSLSLVRRVQRPTENRPPSRFSSSSTASSLTAR